MKIACVYHSVDLDGWMSAAIVKHWFDTTFVGKLGTFKDDPNIIIKPFDSLTFIGYNYGQPIPNLSEYDQVIMCDISFPKEEMDKLYNRLNSEFIWIDHHISAIKEIGNFNPNINEDTSSISGLRITTFAACELTWNYFFIEPMPEIVRLLGRYDCFGHKGTSEEKTVLEFQYGARSVISNIEDAYNALTENINLGSSYCVEIHVYGKSIYSYLKQEANLKFAKRFTLKFGEYSFAAINAERFNPVNFGINYHSYKADDVYFYDGVASFWITPNGIYFSIYNDNGKVDCSVIAKKLGGGGHAGASGFFMPFSTPIVDSVDIYNLKAQLSSILYVGSKK